MDKLTTEQREYRDGYHWASGQMEGISYSLKGELVQYKALSCEEMRTLADKVTATRIYESIDFHECFLAGVSDAITVFEEQEKHWNDTVAQPEWQPLMNKTREICKTYITRLGGKCTGVEVEKSLHDAILELGHYHVSKASHYTMRKALVWEITQEIPSLEAEYEGELSRGEI